MTNPRIYLAGPDVFHPDHRRIFSERVLICRRHGLEPLIPIDNAATTAPAIYEANIRMLRACTAVIANITPFRGPHCDVGTAWEIGYAVAHEMPVLGFSTVRMHLIARIGWREDHVGVDATGMSIEDFGLLILHGNRLESPNKNARRPSSLTPTHVVIHVTGTDSLSSVWETFMAPNSVSAPYLITKEGKLF